MTNNKDFSEQINDLFEDLSLDEAENLIESELKPTKDDQRKEVIDKITKNDIRVDEKILSELKEGVDEETGDDKVLEYLRTEMGLTIDDDVPQEIKEELETVLPPQETVYKKDEEIETVLPTQTQKEDYITSLTDKFGNYLADKGIKPAAPESTEGLAAKLEALQSQFSALKSSMMEGTLVSGIGQGGDGQGPGSGEVRINRMDDVDLGPDGIDGLEEGDALVWDPNANGGHGAWVPGDPNGGGPGGGIQDPLSGDVWGCKKVDGPADLYWGTEKDYKDWYELGNDISTTGAKLVSTPGKVSSVTGCVAFDYGPSTTPGDPPGAMYSKKWVAIGVLDENGIGFGVEISTDGINPDEGYFLYYDKSLVQCVEGIEDFPCQEIPDHPDACMKVESPGSTLMWGTKAEMDANLGTPVKEPGGLAITNCTEILFQCFAGDPLDFNVDRNGQFKVLYKIEGSKQPREAEILDTSPDSINGAFYILGGVCDNPPVPPQPPVRGCVAETGCKEVASTPTSVGNLMWGDGTTGDQVQDSSGIGIANCRKIYPMTATNTPGETYTVDPTTGEITGSWDIVYEDFLGNTYTATHVGTCCDVPPCATGFYIDSTNACLNPPDVEEPDNIPCPGLITGCIESINGDGALYWGNGNKSESFPALDAPSGATVTDVKKLLYVFSVDFADCSTAGVGQWMVLYKNKMDGLSVGWSPTGSDDGSVDGFFLADDCDPSADTELPEPEFGFFPGCRDSGTGDSQVFWGRRDDYENAFAGNANNGQPVENLLGVYITDARKLWRAITFDGIDEWFSVVSKDTGIDFAHYPGSNPPPVGGLYSPPFGFYLIGGDCLADDQEQLDCRVDPPIELKPEGCQKVGGTGGNLIWGKKKDFGTATGEQVATGVQELVSITSENVCDNGFGKWTATYRPASDPTALGVAERYGFNPFADDDDESDVFWLELNGQPCEEEATDEIDDGKDCRGILLGCRRTADIGGAKLFWGTDENDISGEPVIDVEGNPVIDAKFIIGNISLNCDASGFGDWICIFTDVYNKTRTAITYGRSGPEGYYLDPTDCDLTVDDCDGQIYFGYKADCNRLTNLDDTATDWGGALIWTTEAGGTKPIKDIAGDTVITRNVLRTFTYDDCSDPNFDITTPQSWSALHFNNLGILSVDGAETGESPTDGYAIDTSGTPDEIQCDYDDTAGPGGRCDADGECPEGFLCLGGICVRPECHTTDPGVPGWSPNTCPPGTQCVDGICMKPCDTTPDKFPCPPGFVCDASGHCEPEGVFPPRPEGPCSPDGECPDGFECFHGICRPSCNDTPDCPVGQVCHLDICKPNTGCDRDIQCPGDSVCFEGICREPCPNGDDDECAPGYICVGGICLPDPDPDDTQGESHGMVGCSEVQNSTDLSIAGDALLYWGTDDDYISDTGVPVFDLAGQPVHAEKIVTVTKKNVYDNGYGDYTCNYYEPGDNTNIKTITTKQQSPKGGFVASYYLRPEPGNECSSKGPTHDPVFGLIAGCKETDRGGTLHWGTIPEGLDPDTTNPPLQETDPVTGLKKDIICKGIIQVYSLDANLTDPQKGLGNWEIIFLRLDATRGQTTVYGTSGPTGPEGAFMVPSDGSVCIENAFNIVKTDDVLLVNSPRKISTTRADIIGPGSEIIRYNTQEDANIEITNLLSELNRRKPTVHVTTDINAEMTTAGRSAGYVPQRGDLWIDPTDYSIYACDIVGNPTKEEIHERPAEYVIWVELGAATGAATNQSSIFLQTYPPNKPVEVEITDPTDPDYLDPTDPNYPATRLTPIREVKHADIWIDDTTYFMYTWNAYQNIWVATTGDLSALVDNKFEVHMGDTPPRRLDVREGDLWFDTNTAEMRIFYTPKDNISAIWVPVVGTGYVSKPTGTRTVEDGETVSPEEVFAMRNRLEDLNRRLSQLEGN